MTKAPAKRLLALVLCGCGCGTPYLEGSLGQLFALQYDEARLQLAPQDLAVLFVKRRGAGVGADGGVETAANEDYPFKVTMALWDGGIAPNVAIDLTEESAAGVQRGVFSRSVLNDPRTTFPRATRAELTFDRIPEVGQSVKGNFHVTFEDGVEAASGRTVFGPFDVKEVQ